MNKQAIKKKTRPPFRKVKFVTKTGSSNKNMDDKPGESPNKLDCNDGFTSGPGYELIPEELLKERVEPIDIEKVNRLRREIENALELNRVDIPEDIKIATMTLEGKFDTMFYPWNIFKYIKRSKDGIVDVVKGSNKKKKDTASTDDDDLDVDENGNITRKNAQSVVDVEPISKTKSRKGKKSKNRQSEVFLNQVTVSINVTNKEKPVSVKIFNNGTIHFTGCVTIDNLLEATHKLCIECRKNVATIGPDGKVKEIKFVEDPNVLKVENLYDTKADMVNCIFVAPFKIDRPKLQILMKSDGYNATYDSNGHAGVKVKYVSTGQKITIFVFESGSIIIILGKQGFKRINEIFTFIYKYLLENYESIVKNDDITKSILLDYIAKEKPASSSNKKTTQSKKNTTLTDNTNSNKVQDTQIVKPKRGRPRIKRDYENLINVEEIEGALKGRRINSTNAKIQHVDQKLGAKILKY